MDEGMIKKLQDMANVLRKDVLKMTTASKSGHPTTCMSCAEILSVLFFHEMSYEPSEPNNEDADEFILSKGHAAPILYSCLFHAKCIDDDLLSLRKRSSRLEGHPVPASLPWVKVATGSLGQGLSVGVGMALASRLKKHHQRTYVLLGDSECAEGSVYEALAAADHFKLGELTAIIDVNRLGQSKETMLGHDLEKYKKRMESFGAQVIVVDGHNVKELVDAFDAAREEKGKFTVVLAKTYKGHGVSFLDNKEGWHGKPLNEEQLSEALLELGEITVPEFVIKKPEVAKEGVVPQRPEVYPALSYEKGELLATRQAYGKALARLSSVNNMIVATDAETSNSTFSQELGKAHPERFFEAYIAEQNMVGMALGLSKKGLDAYGSTFACFFTRAHDQIRMAALSSANMTLVGSHAGVSIGADGASQMGLGDLAMCRALIGSSVFYPSDAVSMEKLMELTLKTDGVKYIRTSRPKTPVIYDNNEVFPLGGFKVFGEGDVVIVGAGVTLHEALKAQKELLGEGITVSVVDCYCLKPFDGKAFKELVEKNGKKVIVVEDHFPEGGIGDVITDAVVGLDVAYTHLAVRALPHSAGGDELLHEHELDKEAIVKAVKEML